MVLHYYRRPSSRPKASPFQQRSSHGKGGKKGTGVGEKIEPAALYESLRAGRWDECRDILARRDCLVAVRYRDDGAAGEGPLHLGCRRHDTPIDVVEAVCDVDPGQTLSRDRTGATPLHRACARASPRIVELLLYAAPETAAVADDDGRTPLHAATSARRSPAVARAVAKAHPSGARALDRFGNTPLSCLFAAWEDELSRLDDDDDDDDRPPRLPRGPSIDGRLDGREILRGTFRCLTGVSVRVAAPDLRSVRKALRAHDVSVPSKYLRVLFHNETPSSKTTSVR